MSEARSNETPKPVLQPEIPQVLPVRLQRSTPPLGFSLIIGLFVTALACGAWWVGGRMAGEKGSSLVCIFAGVFGFVGLLILWSCLRQLIISRVPVTLVETSEQPFRIGQTARIALIQPGPATLKSLRANLVCLEQHISWRERSDSDGGTESYRQVDEKMIHTENLIEATSIRVPGGDRWQELREFTVPPDARSTSATDDHAIIWRIELWGKGPMLGSFMHPFEIVVLRAGEELPKED